MGVFLGILLGFFVLSLVEKISEKRPWIAMVYYCICIVCTIYSFITDFWHMMRVLGLCILMFAAWEGVKKLYAIYRKHSEARMDKELDIVQGYIIYPEENNDRQ